MWWNNNETGTFKCSQCRPFILPKCIALQICHCLVYSCHTNLRTVQHSIIRYCFWLTIQRLLLCMLCEHVCYTGCRRCSRTQRRGLKRCTSVIKASMIDEYTTPHQLVRHGMTWGIECVDQGLGSLGSQISNLNNYSKHFHRCTQNICCLTPGHLKPLPRQLNVTLDRWHRIVVERHINDQ